MEKVIIYTDGACSGNQNENNFGGWGAVIKHDSGSTEYFGGEINTTNNKMELRAAIEGLKALINTNVEVEMYLDSNYVLQGITSWITGWKKNGWRTSSKKPVENKELWIELDELKSKFNNIKFIKVKGHAGVELNELADQLANKGVDNARKSIVETKQEVKKEESAAKTISYWDRLKLQIDNLELMWNQHNEGSDVSTSVYWQVETLNELLQSFEEKVGADEVRSKYS